MRMKVIGVIQADLETTPLGTQSRLSAEIAGVGVLRRTVERCCEIRSLTALYVVCPSSQLGRVERVLVDLPVKIQPRDYPAPPWRTLIRASRKWSLDGWRGGIGQTVCFDEFTDARVLHDCIKDSGAQLALSIPSAAPLFDPVFGESMIHYRRSKNNDDTRLIFAPVMPGLTGVLLDASLIAELSRNSLPLSWFFAYQPDQPARDLVFEECAMEVPAPLRFARGRLCADTERSFRRVCDLVKGGTDLSLDSIARRLIQRDEEYLEPIPQELEVELTTEDPFPDNALHPRGQRLWRRGELSADLIEKIVPALTSFDDARLVLGGFGDPLRHPEFKAILAQIRRSTGSKPVYALAIRTTGIDLSDDLIESLIEHQVDVLNVVLDAWSAELYGRLHSPNNPSAADLSHVLDRLGRLEDLRQKRGSVYPLVVPELTKSTLNLHELDDFYDGWCRKLGAVSICGYSDHGRQLPSLQVVDMSPPVRRPCRRIRSRAMVLADGRLTTCDQDFRGEQSVGSLHKDSLESLWNAAKIQSLRSAHANLTWDSLALCSNCIEWHRP